MNEVFCLSSDDGVPIPFMDEPSTIDAGVSKASDIFSDIAEHVANRIESDRIEKVKSMERPNVFYDDKRGAIVLRYLAGELEGRSMPSMLQPYAGRAEMQKVYMNLQASNFWIRTVFPMISHPCRSHHRVTTG